MIQYTPTGTHDMATQQLLKCYDDRTLILILNNAANVTEKFATMHLNPVTREQEEQAAARLRTVAKELLLRLDPTSLVAAGGK